MVGKFWYTMYNRDTRKNDKRVSVEDAQLNSQVIAAWNALKKAKDRGLSRPYAMLAFTPHAGRSRGYGGENSPGYRTKDGSRSKFVSATSATVHGMKQLAKGRNVLYFKFDPETLLYNEISMEDITALASAEQPERKRRKKNG